MFNSVDLGRRSVQPATVRGSSFPVASDFRNQIGANYSAQATPIRPISKANLSDQMQQQQSVALRGGFDSLNVPMSNTQRPLQNPVQFVNIRQKDPIINISLQDLLPTYSNVTDNDLISYQVQYFDFPPQEPIKLLKGDKIELQVVSMWSNMVAGMNFDSAVANHLRHGFYSYAQPFFPSFYSTEVAQLRTYEEVHANPLPKGTYETMRRCFTYIYTLEYDLVCD